MKEKKNKLQTKNQSISIIKGAHEINYNSLTIGGNESTQKKRIKPQLVNVTSDCSMKEDSPTPSIFGVKRNSVGAIHKLDKIGEYGSRNSIGLGSIKSIQHH